ncbi:glycosyltransferase [Nocardioides panacisoli]|uniref:Glycosyltransferase n=1 Tax=Nocardioides panacisoli TaxID=627624 RepID=A0ABP7ISF4_9ACTN
MSDFLFVTWDGGGNVPPAAGIATELAARGHTVRFIGHEGNRRQLPGTDFTAYTRARPFASVEKNSLLAHIKMFGDRGMGADVLAELDRRPADLVVVDCMAFGVIHAIERAGIRYVLLEHLYDEYFSAKWLKGPIGLGVRAQRLAPQRGLDAAALRLVASAPELDPAGRRDRPANMVHTGPVVTGTPANPSEPTILVSLSTYNFPGQAAALQRVIDAVAGLDARVVVTTGPAIDGSALRPSSNTEIHDWVRHGELMPEVSLVVGHGGHATTMSALAHDIPLLILPMHPMLDQPMVGRSIAEAGAGRMAKKTAPSGQLRPLIEELLDDGPHRSAAAALGAAIRGARGAATAADRLEAVVRDEVPQS